MEIKEMGKKIIANNKNIEDCLLILQERINKLESNYKNTVEWYEDRFSRNAASIQSLKFRVRQLESKQEEE